MDLALRALRWNVRVLLFLAAWAAPLVASAAPPIGYVDGVDRNGVLSGWAVDPDAPSESVAVHVYMDGPAGSGGTLIGMIKAGVARPDLQGNHGFRYPLPPVTRDGTPHSYWVYGIDTSGAGSENRELSGSPKSAVLNSTIVRITNGVVTVGIEPRCGGVISEIVVNGTNLVNNYDCTGRQVQVAHYDGNAAYDSCAGCSGIWGWNPVQGGDMHGFGSVVLEQRVTSSSIYVKTRPYEWFPDNKGGGQGTPVLSDVMIEQWLSFVATEPYAIKMRFKTTHLGSDRHSIAHQETPATHVNLGFDRLVYYGGGSPWTGAPVSTSTVQQGIFYNTSESWAAYVDHEGHGLTVHVPGQYSYVSGLRLEDSVVGPYAKGVNYLAPFTPFAFNGPSILEGDIYLVAGDYRLARQFIYKLRSTTTTVDYLPPYGHLDTPTSGQTLHGQASIAGWAFDNSSINRIAILVDGVVVGTAAYGQPRPDVTNVYPNISLNIGYLYVLDTTSYPNGQHTLAAQAIDSVGNVATLGTITVTISNSLPPKFSLGDRVKVTRKRADIYRAPDEIYIGTQKMGAYGTVVGGPVARNGYTWWNIDFDGDPDGFAVQNNLGKVAGRSKAGK